MSLQINLAKALEDLRKLVNSKGSNIIHTGEIGRAQRELLLKTQWLQPIIKGWYMASRPDIRPGETSLWYANFWQFVARYLSHHFKNNYCLSAESSIDLHTESPTIPSQVVAIVPKKGSSPIILPFETSILPYRAPDNIPDERIELKGIQVMELGYALCKVTPTLFEKDPQKIEIALRLIRTPEELLGPIIKYNMKTAAGRLIGAYRLLGDDKMADRLCESLRQYGVNVREEKPLPLFTETNRFTIEISICHPNIGPLEKLPVTDRRHFPHPTGPGG